MLAAAVLSFGECRQKDLRGWSVRTPDGGAMLAIDDDCGGQKLWVDRKPWRAGKGVAAPVTAGAHTVECGDAPPTRDDYEAVVPAGRTYHFDYWGP